MTSPAATDAASSSRENQRASASSSPSGWGSGCPRPIAAAAIISEDGNGHGWVASSLHLTDDDFGLLGDLPTHGLFGGLARFDETRQGREPAGRPRPLAAQQRPVARVGDQDDHRRVDPWEVRRAVRRASPLGSGRAEMRGAATARTVRVGRVPLGKSHRVAEPADVVGESR